MGRGKGKGKKFSVTNHDDAGSAEEEKIPAQKRRGRPQKALMDEVEDNEVAKIEDEDSEITKVSASSNEMKTESAFESNENKKRRNTQAKENPESVTEEDGMKTRSTTDDSKKLNGFRHSGSRRKNKPHRAAVRN